MIEILEYFDDRYYKIQHAPIAQLWLERNIGNVEVLSSILSPGFSNNLINTIY